MELIIALVIAWLLSGYVGWRIQIRRIKPYDGTFDHMMVAPCMLGGPFILVLAIRG